MRMMLRQQPTPVAVIQSIVWLLELLIAGPEADVGSAYPPLSIFNDFVYPEKSSVIHLVVFLLTAEYDCPVTTIHISTGVPFEFHEEVARRTKSNLTKTQPVTPVNGFASILSRAGMSRRLLN